MILVTAATATVGSAVFKSLAENGLEVRAAVRNPQAFLAAHPGADVVALDFDQPETFGPHFGVQAPCFCLLHCTKRCPPG